MLGHVHNGHNRIWIALFAVTFDSSANAGFSNNQVCQLRCIDELRVRLELLNDESLESDVVYVGVEVEELEVDIDEALLRDRRMTICQVVAILNIRTTSLSDSSPALVCLRLDIVGSECAKEKGWAGVNCACRSRRRPRVSRLKPSCATLLYSYHRVVIGKLRPYIYMYLALGAQHTNTCHHHVSERDDSNCA
jgi:hypothetical protein